MESDVHQEEMNLLLASRQIDNGQPLQLADLKVVNGLLQQWLVQQGESAWYLAERCCETPANTPICFSNSVGAKDCVGPGIDAPWGAGDIRLLEALLPEKDPADFAEWDASAPSRSHAGRTQSTSNVVKLRALSACLVQGEPLKRSVTRRPQQRELSDVSDAAIESWFGKSQLMIGEAADTEEKKARARRLLYTWQDVFAFSMEDIVATDLVEHRVVIAPGAVPYRLRQPKYKNSERDFAHRIFPQLERMGWIVPGISPWAAYTRFPPKSNGDLRVVMNYQPINKFTMKPQWPVHHKAGVFQTVATGNHRVFFQSDAAHGFWAVKTAQDSILTTSFITPNAQYLSLRMPQGMTGSPHTYCALGDIGFGAWPAKDGEDGPGWPSLFGYHRQWSVAFDCYIDDHSGSATDFDSLFDFLHHHYFPRVAFMKVRLTPRKTEMFSTKLVALGFEIRDGQRVPAEKHRKRFANWAKPENHPKSPQELDAFLFLLPYLKEFIPGRTDLTNVLKRSHMVRTQKQTPTGRQSVQWTWVPAQWNWGSEQAEAWVNICQKVQNGAIHNPIPGVQYHITVDTSGTGTGAVLFQMPDMEPGTQNTPKTFSSVRILSFMSWKLSDAETRYYTGEREALGLVRALTECRALILDSPHPVLVYTDHLNLLTVLGIEGEPSGRVARWVEYLGMFDFQVVHRSGTDKMIQIADGLSRLRPEMSEEIEQRDLSKPPLIVATGRVVKRKRGSGSRVDDADADKRSHWTLPLGPRPGAAVVVDAKFKKSDWYRDTVESLLGEKKHQFGKRRWAIRLLRYALWQGILLIKEAGSWAVCVVRDEIGTALRWAHDEKGHFGPPTILTHLIGKFWWPTRYADTMEYFKTCRVCQSTGQALANRYPVMGISGNTPWELVGMDATGRIRPDGYDGSTHVLLTVDYFSRFVKARAIAEPTARVVIDFWRETSGHYGFPMEVYCDNARYFSTEELATYFGQHGTRLSHGATYSPWSLGLAESAVKLFKGGLKKWAAARDYQSLDRWPDFVDEIMSNINNRGRRGEPYTPSQLMLGRQMRQSPDADIQTPIPSENVVTPEHAMHAGQWESWREVKLAQIREKQSTTEQQATDFAAGYEVGDLVWELVPDGRDSRLHHFVSDQRPDGSTRLQALRPRWCGPWEVTAQVSPVSFQVINYLTRRKSHRVHVRNMKPYLTRHNYDSTEQTSKQPSYRASGNQTAWGANQREDILLWEYDSEKDA